MFSAFLHLRALRASVVIYLRAMAQGCYGSPLTRVLLSLAAWLAPWCGLCGRASSQDVSFIRDVAPVLVERCVGCHGPKQAESNYRLDTFQALQTVGDFGESPVTPGKVDESLLAALVASDDPHERMPKESEPLTGDQIASLKAWIAAGASFDGADPNAPLAGQLPRPSYPDAPAAYASPIPVTALALHLDGVRLVVGGYRELIEWNLDEAKISRRVSKMAERTLGLALHPDGMVLAIAGGTPGRRGEVRLLDANDYSEVRLLGTSDDVALDCAFSPDGKRLAAAFADHSIRLYDVATGRETLALENHADFVAAIAWADDGSRIASASRDGSAKVFDAESGELLATYAGHGQPVHGVALAPDGVHAFSSGADKRVHQWKLVNGEHVGHVTDFPEESYKLAVRQGQLFSFSASGAVRQHDAQTLQIVREYGPHSDAVLSLTVDVGRGRLATGGFDGQVRLWKLADGALLQSFIAAPGMDASPSAP